MQLVSAARDLDYHFHQLHEKDKAPIEQRRFCSEEDVEVTWEEVAHGYDLDGKQVVLTDEELGSVEPRKTRTIEIEAFVELARGRPDLLRPSLLPGPGRRQRGHAARLPAARRGDGPRRSSVALGRFVMRTKEYLAAVRARDGALALTTMLFHDEVRPTGKVPTGGKKPSQAASTTPSR